MEQRVSLVTLGVDDLGRSRAFYEGLGWHGQEVEETVFFQAGCLVLALWGRDALAADAGLGGRQGDPEFAGIVLAHNVRDRAEVDDLLQRAADLGGRITRAAAPTFYGGYAGYFADPDGHVWEVAHNPGMPLAADGALVLPVFAVDGADADLADVIGRESRLLDPAVRSRPEAGRDLLHPDFVEFGVSGRVWDRDGVLAAMAADPGPLTTADDLRATRLSPGVVLLTYRIKRPDRTTLRSSLWRLDETGWRLLFHQGTHDPGGVSSA
jgi:predicted lactoylglutathione lyase